MNGSNQTGESMFFNANDRRYRCCCRSCHSRTGIVVLAVLDAAVFTSMAILTIRDYAHISDSGEFQTRTVFKVLFYGSMALCSLVLFSVTFILIAICSERSFFVVPYLIWRILSCILIAISAVFMIVMLIAGKDTMHDAFCKAFGMKYYLKIDTKLTEARMKSTLPLMMGLILGIVVVSFVVSIWCFLVAKSCYDFYSDKRRLEVLVGGPAMYPPAPPIQGTNMGRVPVENQYVTNHNHQTYDHYPYPYYAGHGIQRASNGYTIIPGQDNCHNCSNNIEQYPRPILVNNKQSTQMHYPLAMTPYINYSPAHSLAPPPPPAPVKGAEFAYW